MKQRDWRGVTALELLLAERLRRAEVCVDETAEAQRLRVAVAAAIEASYVVTRSRRHCVKAGDVWLTAREALAGLKHHAARRQLFKSVVEELGGVFVFPRNRKLINGVRPAALDDVEAVQYSKEMRRDLWASDNPEAAAQAKVKWEVKSKRRAKWRAANGT